MRTKSLRCVLLAGGIAMTFIPRPCFAQPYFVRAATRVQTSGFGVCDPQFNNDDTGRIQALSISSGPFTATSSGSHPCASATTTAFGSAELGVLHGHSNFSAATPGAASGAHGQAIPVEWGDTITVHSNSLPPGTQVGVQATITFHRSYSVTPGGQADVQTGVSGPFGMQMSDNSANPNPAQSVTANSTVFTETPFQVNVSLGFQAGGTAFVNQGVSGSLDIPSVVFTLVCTTPDTFYTTAGGMSYVPLLDADLNVSGLGDGLDVAPFVDAILTGSTAASDLYHSDFDNDGKIGLGDVSGFSQKLLGL